MQLIEPGGSNWLLTPGRVGNGELGVKQKLILPRTHFFLCKPLRLSQVLATFVPGH